MSTPTAISDIAGAVGPWPVGLPDVATLERLANEVCASLRGAGVADTPQVSFLAELGSVPLKTPLAATPASLLGAFAPGAGDWITHPRRAASRGRRNCGNS